MSPRGSGETSQRVAESAHRVAMAGFGRRDIVENLHAGSSLQVRKKKIGIDVPGWTRDSSSTCVMRHGAEIREQAHPFFLAFDCPIGVKRRRRLSVFLVIDSGKPESRCGDTAVPGIGASASMHS